ncbi:HTH domain-containing protein [Halegenticoccus soli]|uniref:HTH domain-containing protein n=1 Tax=Halegenticoccus soli TaxID=1985678 RepID=UPI000C6E66FD|nr:HTH domain-containing protein [Halegenticoccus soli]
MTDSEHLSTSVTLFVRARPAFGAEEYKREVMERIAELERGGRLERFDVRTWEKAVRDAGPLERCESLRSVFRRLEEFERWADRNGVSVDGVFRRREVHSAITDERYAVVSLPTLCLVAYEGGELRGVYPHSDGSDTRTVFDFLDALQRDR